MGGKHAEIRTDTSTGFQFSQLPVQPVDQPGFTQSREMASSATKAKCYQEQKQLDSQTIHVFDRSADGYGKTGLVRSPPYEPLTMTSEATLAHSGSLGKDYSGPNSSPSTPKLVVRREERTPGSTVASTIPRPANFYRHLKRRLGCTLKGLHCKRRLVKYRKPSPHQFSGVKSSLSGDQEFRASLQGPNCSDSTTVVSYINKEGGMRSSSLCALLWRLLSWCHPRGIVLKARHIPGRLNVIADKLSRHNQVIQTEWSLSQQVFNLLCSRWGSPHVDLYVTRFNHKLPKYMSPVLDQTAWAVDILSLLWENLDAYAFPPVSLLNQVISKVMDQGCRKMCLTVFIEINQTEDEECPPGTFQPVSYPRIS